MFCLQSGQNHAPLGSSLMPTHFQWNHSNGQSSLSHATISPELTCRHVQYFVVSSVSAFAPTSPSTSISIPSPSEPSPSPSTTPSSSEIDAESDIGVEALSPDFRFPECKRRRFADDAESFLAGLRCPIRWWGGPARGGFFVAGRGPALLPRAASCAASGLGVPGPREDWRRFEEVGGIERCPPWRLRRRRLEGSVEDERLGLKDKPVAEAGPLAVTGGFGAVAGEAWRTAAPED